MATHRVNDLTGTVRVLGERSTNESIMPVPAATGTKRKAAEPPSVIDLGDIDLEGDHKIKKRDIVGAKVPAKKQKASAAASKSCASDVTTVDISSISLPGEATDEVEIYDSCDEIRKKIKAYLTKPGATQAQFCRDLAAQYHSATKRIQSKQLTDFRSKKGAASGNTSIVYYTSYVFFEKIRIALGRPKSKHRLGMEEVHAYGIDTTRVMSGRAYIVPRGVSVWTDSFGQVTCGRL